MRQVSGADSVHVCRVVDEDGYASEDTFYVTAEERVSLKMHNKNVPYVTSAVRCQTPRATGAVAADVIINLSQNPQTSRD